MTKNQTRSIFRGSVDAGNAPRTKFCRIYFTGSYQPLISQYEIFLNEPTDII